MIRYLCTKTLNSPKGIFERNNVYSMVHRDPRKNTMTFLKDGHGVILDDNVAEQHFRLCARRHEILKGSEVVFLHGTKLVHGLVTKVNDKSCRIVTKTEGAIKTFERMVKKERVAHVDDICTVVLTCRDDAERTNTRFDYELYPHHAKKATKWGHVSNFIVEDGAAV